MIWLAAWLIAFVVAGAALAQTSSRSWRTFDALDGVTANWVFDIAQTPDAALWFATDTGVLRFDGVWQEVNDGLPADMALSLAVDAAGNLWVGAPHGVARWDGDGWEHQGMGTELGDAAINDLLALPNGDLWAGGQDGLFAWSPDGGWRRVTGLPMSGIDHMALDARQGAWLAQGSTVYRLEDDGWRDIPLGEQEEGFGVTAMSPDPSGGMWVATEARGVVHITDREMVWETTESGLPSDRALALLTARDGALWVGTNGGGAARLGDGGWEPLTLADGLAADFVSALFEDSDGVFWFGTAAGVTRYDAASWRAWKDGDAPQDRISALALGDDGLWAAQGNGELFRLQGDVWEKVTLRVGRRPLKLSGVETLFLDRDGQLWLGTHTQGVVVFDGKRARQWTRAEGLAEDFVTAIAQSKDGAMWFGTRSGGLSRWDGRHWKEITTQDGLISNEVTALLVDDEGALWVGTRDGISQWDGSAWRAFITDDGLGGNDITALAQDEDGAVWAATWGGGVSRWQDGVWETFDARNGLAPSGVETLLTTPGQVWMGSVSGLSVYDGRSWQQFSHAYGYDVGRVYALAGDDEAIYLGGDEGVIRFRPEKTPPSLHMITINGRMPEANVIALDAGAQAHVMLQGSDIHSQPDDLLYLMRLEGVDADWRQGRSPTLSYPPLEPGDYTFRAQVRDPSMNYAPPVVLTLQVRKPQSAIAIPGLGHVHPGLALAGVAFLTLFVAVVGYASWTTALRWHMRQQAVERRFNPYIAGSPIRSRDMFFGREQLLRDLKGSLAHNSMMLYGERRIGKTSLLYRLLEDLPRLEDKKFRFFPVFVDLEGTPEDAFFHQLMEGLLDALQEPLADFPARQKLQYHLLSEQTTYTDRHMRRDLRQIIGHLKKRTERAPRLIFLLDEADILSSYNSLTQQQFRRILQDVFARNVGAIISGVYISKAWDRLESPWYNMFVEIIVPPLNRYEAEMLMRKPVLGFYEWDDEAVEFVWRRTHGRPHRIQQIAREAVNRMLEDGRRRITLDDVRRGYERVVFAERLLGK